ncbi:dihydroorotate dehydrogenase electron transfer subunit [Candidatus Aerophobetes bacterium]|nr:dihydroorotate dehydrogenase electron transfer subunit [Candidatus Aerophobetes bacterium]
MSESGKGSFSVARQLEAEVLSNVHLGADFYRLTLKVPPFFQKAQPGQFIHIRIGRGFLPLLRRPFSISDLTPEGIEVLYKIKGKGTEILSRVKEGEFLDIMGPLGKGFFIEGREKIHVLVGGGTGVAPLVFLCRKILEKTKENSSILVFLGFKTVSEIVCEEKFKKEGIVLRVATDDGSRGYRGSVCELFAEYLKTIPENTSLSLYACGPLEMLRGIAELVSGSGFFSQVLIEEIICCGVGACGGCVIKGRKGYFRVCRDGPVFRLEDIF